MVPRPQFPHLRLEGMPLSWEPGGWGRWHTPGKVLPGHVAQQPPALSRLCSPSQGGGLALALTLTLTLTLTHRPVGLELNIPIV